MRDMPISQNDPGAEPVHEFERRLSEVLRELAHEFGNLNYPLQLLLELQTRSNPLSAEEVHRVLAAHVAELSLITTRIRLIGQCLSGATELFREDVRCGDLVQAALDECQTLLRDRARTVRHDLRAATEIVHVDRQLIERALVELLTNAIRFAHGADGVRVDVRQSGDLMEFVVCDDGPGVPSALRPRMFEMFVRGGPRLNIKEGQMGCGLAFARRIAALHGGVVELRNSSGAGSEFVLSLPVH